MRSNNALNMKVSYTSNVNPIRSPKKFTKKNVDLAETPLFFPEGYEKLFLGLYFVTLPYIAGLLFLFFYVAKGSLEVFLSLNKEQAFILTWAIGYEIIASLVLLWIFKMSINFANEPQQPGMANQMRRL